MISKHLSSDLICVVTGNRFFHHCQLSQHPDLLYDMSTLGMAEMNYVLCYCVVSFCGNSINDNTKIVPFNTVFFGLKSTYSLASHANKT